MAIDGDPVGETVRLLAAGRIVAIKGIGGYHLACRADSDDAVRTLRERKLRDGKPLAVMVPSVEAAQQVCRLAPADLKALTSPAAPIVLAAKNPQHGLAADVAPGCNTFGIMLPYAPLHHLLFAAGLRPLVMTSANLSSQPLTYRDEDALRDLADVADAFLLHNREIFRPIDDSVVLTFRDHAVPIRRARGYAPQPLRLSLFDDGGPLAGVRDVCILAVGGELKSTVCLLRGGEAILSEHLGDLSNPQAYRHFVQAIERLKDLFGFEPDVVAHDLHPRYLSTQYAQGLTDDQSRTDDQKRVDDQSRDRKGAVSSAAQGPLPYGRGSDSREGHSTARAIAVQHHHAHIVSVMAEWNEPGPVIGLSCDGTGYGTDRAIWGCEVLHCRHGDFERVGHMDYFPLVGADAAAIETWRPAAALLRQAYGGEWIARMRAIGDSVPLTDLQRFEQQAAAGLNAPSTSSLGRVFDAVSYLLGLCGRNRHEAEAPMALEAAATEEGGAVAPYPYEVTDDGERIRLSLLPAITAIVQAREAGESPSHGAARFHETLAQLLTDAAVAACDRTGVQTVALSGGCFANRLLLTRLVELLEARNLKVLYHRNVPTGDGGLALGQAIAAAWQLAEMGA